MNSERFIKTHMAHDRPSILTSENFVNSSSKFMSRKTPRWVCSQRQMQPFWIRSSPKVCKFSINRCHRESRDIRLSRARFEHFPKRKCAITAKATLFLTQSFQLENCSSWICNFAEDGNITSWWVHYLTAMGRSFRSNSRPFIQFDLMSLECCFHIENFAPDDVSCGVSFWFGRLGYCIYPINSPRWIVNGAQQWMTLRNRPEFCRNNLRRRQFCVSDRPTKLPIFLSDCEAGFFRSMDNWS
jgi:hypothetical protein